MLLLTLTHQRCAGAPPGRVSNLHTHSRPHGLLFDGGCCARSRVEEEERPLVDTQLLSAPARMKRALTFWSRVVPILGAYKAVEVTSEILSDLPASVREKATDIGLPTSKDAEEALYEDSRSSTTGAASGWRGRSRS